MQINAIIKADGKESITAMLLTSRNSTNPFFWGKDLKYSINGELIEPTGINIKIPTEFDFFHAFCGKDPQNAKEYYKI